MTAELTPVEARIIGCLIEKQRTTPDAYPLTINSLRLACNQATNRDPVTNYDEDTVRDAVHRLTRRGYARLASGAGSRAAKYRHLLVERDHVTEPELAVLAPLLLRGAQTPGELRARSERLHQFESAGDAQAAIDALVARGWAVQLARRPGQKEIRYLEQLTVDSDAAALDANGGLPGGGEQQPAAPAGSDDDGRVGALEQQLIALRSEVTELRTQLTALRDELGA